MGDFMSKFDKDKPDKRPRRILRRGKRWAYDIATEFLQSVIQV